MVVFKGIWEGEKRVRVMTIRGGEDSGNWKVSLGGIE